MEQAFERIITGFAENRVGHIDHFLNEDLSRNLQDHLLSLLHDQQFKAAGIGNNSNFITNKLIRSDLIYWLGRRNNNQYENSFFDIIDAFVTHLNITCFTGIVGYEFHYAYYDEGSFYKRHLDQFKDDSHRAYSMIMYLNKDWSPADGGQLCIYHPDTSQLISPKSGNCVFFKSSELEHEVLLSHKPRMSITGWLKTA